MIRAIATIVMIYEIEGLGGKTVQLRLALHNFGFRALQYCLFHSGSNKSLKAS